MRAGVNVRMSNFMRTPIRLGVRTYVTYANCQTLGGDEISFLERMGLD